MSTRETPRTVPASQLKPAPYLIGIPSVPQGMFEGELKKVHPPEDIERHTDRMIRRLKREIFQRRTAHEAREGIKIISEPTTMI